MQAKPAAPTVAPTLKRNSVTHAWITDPVFIELASEAQRRRVHPDRLTAAIVEKVIRNGLVDALLDDPRFACTK
ncbi:hypothetical protein [Bradyrhizobium roseum]|uniref:hypothetical protein n=1 Tax=Bradyrhizobium roseum TaxID=3056648 RepID=UPI00262B6C3B|nr:hypothetical protein [Bradyrhizobium roseus]WKA31593.1 hypothetical protein QUH67_16160 [Bradyrhizobium roseus]